MASTIDIPSKSYGQGVVEASGILEQTERWDVSGSSVLAAWGVSIFGGVRLRPSKE